jgi:hypothetical protein
VAATRSVWDNGDMFSPLRKVLDWIVDHASWDLAMRGLEKAKWKAIVSSVGSAAFGVWGWLSRRPWPEIVLIALGAFAVVWLLLELFFWHKYKRAIAKQDHADKDTASETVRRIETIRFDYLPATTPLEHGWKDVSLPEHQRQAKGTVQFNSDPDLPGSLRMRVTNGAFAMHYDFLPHSTTANQIEFKARYSTTTMIHALLIVSTRDRSAQRRVFVQIKYGNLSASPMWPNPNPGRDGQKWLQEQVLHWPADVFGNGCLAFRFSWNEVVKTLLGTEGWVFKSVEGIRLRGDLSISPIDLQLLPNTK